jgi:hypothetical protein
LLGRLNNSSFLTLEDAKNLRSDFGGAASSAERAGNAKLSKVLWTAYDQIGEGMKGRIQELSGTTKSFDHYNNEFSAFYELKRKGVSAEMLDSIPDRHDSIPKLKSFAGADLTEIKDQAQKYGMKPEDFDAAQKNAKSVLGAHDSLSGKYNKSLYKLALGGGAATATAVSVLAAAHGAGIYGLAPMLLYSYAASKAMGIPAQMDTGVILKKLGVKNPDAFQVRTQVEGPQNFTYPNQDDLYGGGPQSPRGGPSSPPPSPEAAKADAVREATAQRYGPPKADFKGKVPPENMGFNPNPAPDYGNKVRADVERRMGGPLKRGETVAKIRAAKGRK